MSRASYRKAVDWIARNDDTNDLENGMGEPIPTVTMSLVADLFDKDDSAVRRDVLKALKRADR
jgi:hypothetical protein